jgi:hypothetical protein
MESFRQRFLKLSFIHHSLSPVYKLPPWFQVPLGL